MLFKIGVLKNFAVFTGKHLRCSLFLVEHFIKKRLQHRCFHVNVPKCLRTAFLYRTLCWLFLFIGISVCVTLNSQRFDDRQCSLKCSNCNICVHTYTCSCVDFLLYSTIYSSCSPVQRKK